MTDNNEVNSNNVSTWDEEKAPLKKGSSPNLNTRIDNDRGRKQPGAAPLTSRSRIQSREDWEQKRQAMGNRQTNRSKQPSPPPEDDLHRTVTQPGAAAVAAAPAQMRREDMSDLAPGVPQGRGLNRSRKDWEEKRGATMGSSSRSSRERIRSQPGAIREDSSLLAPGVPNGRGLRRGAEKKRANGRPSPHPTTANEDGMRMGEEKMEEDLVVITTEKQQETEQQAVQAIDPNSNSAISNKSTHSVGDRHAGNIDPDQVVVPNAVQRNSIPSTRNLAVATLILDEPSYHDLVTAQEIDLQVEEEEKTKRKQGLRTKVFVTFALSLLAIVVIVVVLVVVLTTKSDSKSETATSAPSLPMDPTSSPTQAPTLFSSYVFTLLPPHSQDIIAEENNNIMVREKSPQTEAYQWMMDDPNIANYPEWRLLQRFALATIYFATDGDGWYNTTNWLSYSHSECDWYTTQPQWGYHCLGGINGAFVQLSLCTEEEGESLAWYDDDYHTPFRNETLDVPLGRIQDLSLSNNGLSGTLPSQIGLLTSMRLLDLSNNKLDGAIPPTIGLLKNLIELALNNNNLQAIPTAMGDLANMVQLSLGNNRLQGQLPRGIGNWTSLRHLYLEDNLFTGPLPTELGLLSSSLDKIYLFRNQLDILSVPTEMGFLTTIRELLLADQSFLPPTIPTEFGLLQSLTSLDIIGQYGIDSSSGHGEGGYEFEYDLKRHLWSGTIPTELGMMESLRSLYLNDNNLEGTLPTELGLMWSLWNLDLQNNNLHGRIPWEIAQLNARLVIVAGNQLTGTIPFEMSYMIGLEELDLSENEISGKIPSEFGNMVRAMTLPLSGISGCGEAFRRELQWDITDGCLYGLGCPGLKSLNLRSNLITGPIPSELGMLALDRLDLSNNDLTGQIPEELNENLTLMEVFCVHDNQLSGTLAPEIGFWDRLEEFNVAHNRMSGPIPVELGPLANQGTLQKFNVTGNEFLGILPAGLCWLNSSLAFDCHPWMCGCSCGCHQNNTRSPTQFPSQTPTQAPTTRTTLYIQFHLGYRFSNETELRSPDSAEVDELIESTQYFIGSQLYSLNGYWGDFAIVNNVTTFDADQAFPVVQDLDAILTFAASEDEMPNATDIFDFMASLDYDEYIEWWVRWIPGLLFSNATMAYFEPAQR